MWYWLAIMIVFIVIELAVPGLVSIWLAIAAAIMIAVSSVVINPIYQVLIFAIISGVLLILTRPFVNKLKNKKDEITGRIIGKEVKIEEIDEKGVIHVYLDGKHWSCKSDNQFSVGEKALVERIEGNKLIIKREDK